MEELKEEFCRIKENHRKAILERVAKTCFGSSTGRVFTDSSQIKERLRNIDADELLGIQSDGNFKEWFENKLDEVAEVIPKITSRGIEITDGVRKWGYGAKILNLFLRDITLHCRYFTEKDADRIQHFLYVPLDGIIIDRLFELREQLSFKKIKDIDTPDKFYDVQDKLKQAANEVGVPRIWFDDNWGNRTQTDKIASSLRSSQ